MGAEAVRKDDTQDLRRADRPLVTVIIPTFKRPALIVQCILSCSAQKDLAPGTFEIVVVDNCPDGSALSAVTKASELATVSVEYIHEPKPGISAARNAGLNRARGRFAAFIDDDEIATENWLSCLIQTQQSSKADVVFGPVLPCMPDTPDTAHHGFFKLFLTHSINHSSGSCVGSTILTPFWARGGKAYPELSTANCLISRESPSLIGMQFDSRLGGFGGEDALYFNQLVANGGHLVWCAEAVVWEHVPVERLSLRYALTRAFRGGQVVSWTPMLLAPARPALATLSMSIALLQVPVFSFLAMGCALIGSSRRHHFLARLASAIGKLLWAAPFRKRAWPSWRGVS
jgi:succinoglycan biosynthesis protein ExoM